MLSNLIQKENTQIAEINKKGVVAYPIKINEIEKNKKEIIIGILLLNLEITHPEIGRPIIELIGIAKSMVPSSASLKLKNVLIVGILEAQVAKHNPAKKK